MILLDILFHVLNFLLLLGKALIVNTFWLFKMVFVFIFNNIFPFILNVAKIVLEFTRQHILPTIVKIFSFSANFVWMGLKLVFGFIIEIPKRIFQGLVVFLELISVILDHTINLLKDLGGKSVEWTKISLFLLNVFYILVGSLLIFFFFKLFRNLIEKRKKSQQKIFFEKNIIERTASTTPNKDFLFEDKLACVICMENQKQILFYDCKHVCVCQDCMVGLFKSSQECPICKSFVKRTEKIFIC